MGVFDIPGLEFILHVPLCAVVRRYIYGDI